MRILLLAAAAPFAVLAFASTPTFAQHRISTTASDRQRLDEPFPDRRFACNRDRRSGDHDGDRRDRRFGDCVFVGGSLGYLDYGDYDANRSFDPDKWNDWWHERPYRAYPRWVQEQRGGPCEPGRMWWSGTGWHC